MFFKSTKKPEINPEKEASEKLDQNLIKQVHTMPSRYYLPPKKSNSGLVIMIIIGLLIILVLSVAAFYLNEALKKASQSNVTQGQVQGEIEKDLEEEPQVQDPIEIVEPTTTPEVIIDQPINPTTTPAIEDEDQDVPVSATPIEPSLDSDKDNLTDAEEALLGTNPNDADTDKDGYPDGSELLSGYDPKQVNKKLSASGLFTSYSNSQFQTIYPATWRIRENDQAGSEVLFIAGNGQFFEVLILDKPSELSLSEWLASQFDQNLPQTTAQKINDFDALKEADNLTYYLMNPSAPGKVYLLTYNIGNATQADFTSLFVVLVKNFKQIK